MLKLSLDILFNAQKSLNVGFQATRPHSCCALENSSTANFLLMRDCILEFMIFIASLEVIWRQVLDTVIGDLDIWWEMAGGPWIVAKSCHSFFDCQYHKMVYGASWKCWCSWISSHAWIIESFAVTCQEVSRLNPLSAVYKVLQLFKQGKTYNCIALRAIELCLCFPSLLPSSLFWVPWEDWA